MATIIHLEQNTPQWLAFRNDKIGASDAPIIMGLSRYKTRESLLLEKLGLVAPRKTTKAQARGHAMEEEARLALEIEHGRLFTPCVMQHDKLHWMVASLDGLSIDGKTALEIKNVRKEDHLVALSGCVPPQYYYQCMQQLLVSGAQELIYWSYCRSRPALVTLRPSQQDFDELIAAGEEFYQELQYRKGILNGHN